MMVSLGLVMLFVIKLSYESLVQLTGTRIKSPGVLEISADQRVATRRSSAPSSAFLLQRFLAE